MSQCKHYDAETDICTRLTSACEPMMDIVYCNHGPCPYEEPITNYDRIKAMSIEKMAEFLMGFVTEALTNPKCIVVKKWLESEVDTDAK